MNDIQNKPAESSELAELRDQCVELRRQTTILLAGLILLSFTVAFFVGFQVRRAGRELDAIRPQARQMSEAFAKEEPTINAFMAKLVEYGRAHPEFLPIIQKYRMNTNQAAAKGNTNSAPAAPGPAK